MTGKNKKIEPEKLLIILYTVVLFFLLCLSSESIFIYKNQPEKLAKVFLYLAQIEIEKGRLDKTIRRLDKAADFYLIQNRAVYKDKIPTISIKNKFTSLDEKTKGKISDYLNKRLPKARGEKSVLLTSNIYYNLALITYSGGYYDIANTFFRTAICLHPELSFLFIELANSYFNNGDIERGIETLKYCLEFDLPKRHCSEYLEKNVVTKSFVPVGTFKDFVPKYQGLNNI